MLEEHMAVTGELGFNYINHVLPITSTSKDITKTITNFCTVCHIDFTTILALGVHETLVITGNTDDVFFTALFCKKSLH